MGQSPEYSSGVGNSCRALEDHRGGHVDEPLDAVVDRGAEDRVVERVVDLGQRVGSLWKFAMPPTIAARWMTWCSPRSRARLVEVAQVARVDLAPLAHPVRRRALVGDAHLAARSRSRRRTTAAPIVPAPPVTRTRLTIAARASAQRGQLGGVGEHLGGAEAVPRVHDERVGRAQRARWRAASAGAELGVVGRDDDGVGALHGLFEAASATRRRGSWMATSASSRSSRRISLCASESRSSSVSRLKASPSTATLRPRSDRASRA